MRLPRPESAERLPQPERPALAPPCSRSCPTATRSCTAPDRRCSWRFFVYVWVALGREGARRPPLPAVRGRSGRADGHGARAGLPRAGGRLPARAGERARRRADRADRGRGRRRARLSPRSPPTTATGCCASRRPASARRSPRGWRRSDPATDVVVVVDSDTVWQPGALREMLRPFADPRVGGVTPRQAIFDVGTHPVRRLADWIEDLRYHLTVPAQSVFGQVGCLAGRTIAYRRDGVRAGRRGASCARRVFGVPQHVGDDRVLTNELLRDRLADRLPVDRARARPTRPRTGAPSGASSCAGAARASARRCSACAGCGGGRSRSRRSSTDIVTPFALYAVSRSASPTPSGPAAPAGRCRSRPSSLLGYVGMVASIGIRQIPHFRRRPRDLRRLPLFVLQLTFLMVPIRIARFRDDAPPVAGPRGPSVPPTSCS